MMTRLSRALTRFSKGWVTLVALVIFLLFTAIVLPEQSSKAKASAGGAGSPDLSFYYSSSDLYQMAESYGEAGRMEYVHARFTFDVVWPFVYLFFLVTSMSWIDSRAYAEDSRWQLSNLLPLLGGLLDFLENFSTSLVMYRFPAPTPVVDSLASFFTMSKWVVIGLSIIFLLAGIVVAIIRSLFKKRYVS